MTHLRTPLALLPLALAGCLLPQSVEEAPPTPEVQNHPPRVLPDTALAEGSARRHLVVQKGCREVRFELGVVQDLDASDDVEVRWFVGYDDGDVLARRVTVLRGGPDVQDGVRSPAGDEFQLELDRLATGRPVVVEAWVSDGFDDPTLEPAWRRVRAGRDADEVTWVVELQEGVCAL